MSTGPMTDLRCLHCGTGYCGACLHGEAGKMESLIKCANCGKKPRTKPIDKIKWKGQNHIAQDVKLGVFDTKMLKDLRPGLHADTQNPKSSNKSESRYRDNFSSGAGSAASGYQSSNQHSRPNSRSASRQRLNGSVFSRLTNSKGYPGTHKHRFDSDGKGRGLAGRDYCPKGLAGSGASTNALQIYDRAAKSRYGTSY